MNLATSMEATRNRLAPLLIAWPALALVVTVLIGLIAVAVQQDLRQGANDPQIQMAEDAAAALAAGRTPQSLVSATPVDLANSLAPYLIVFDSTGRVIASGATLNGQTPVVPSGVFDTVRQSGEERVTWQPQPGVREAAVVDLVKGNNPGFVLAGRSLREVEAREDNLRLMVLVAWLAAMAILAAAGLLVMRSIRPG